MLWFGETNVSNVHSGPGGLTIEAPVEPGLIRVLGYGFWSPAIVDAHFRELRSALAPYREAGAPGRMFIDLRTSDVQSPETVARMQEGVLSVTQEGGPLRDRRGVELGEDADAPGDRIGTARVLRICGRGADMGRGVQLRRGPEEMGVRTSTVAYPPAGDGRLTDAEELGTAAGSVR